MYTKKPIGSLIIMGICLLAIPSNYQLAFSERQGASAGGSDADKFVEIDLADIKDRLLSYARFHRRYPAMMRLAFMGHPDVPRDRYSGLDYKYLVGKDGMCFAVYSVGNNGIDDQGAIDDIVVKIEYVDYLDLVDIYRYKETGCAESLGLRIDR